ncbi:MAG: adenine phosphoribosyltransferase [Deltaproteobacteria bacterium]|nr:adenine phosphoribosyltransferase [Deltaproteobacteria bacterium]MBT7202675.1 adenine phosphoribosyltransferase [Deltaproteobacteria bacterium]
MNEPAVHLKSFVRTIPDFPKPGILFRDITTLLSNPAAFQETLQLLSSRYRNAELHAICGIESRGFLIGAPLALELGIAFVPIRKPGKLPAAVERVEYSLEYGTDSLEIHKDALQPGQRVLLADDLLATGGTISAAAQLVHRLDTIVHEAAFIIELEGLGGREKLSCPAFSLMRFTEE